VGCFFVAGETHPCPLTILAVPLCCREVALEEFEDFSNVQDSVFVRIANIPLQESIRDLRWEHGWSAHGFMRLGGQAGGGWVGGFAALPHLH
jgi:hypothetical protein